MDKQNRESIKKRWAILEKDMSKRFGEMPEVKTMLFLIGIQEFPSMNIKSNSKQANLDIIHVGVCKVLEKRGYYKEIGVDKEGWPHFRNIKLISSNNQRFSQEGFIKESIMDYLDY